MAILLMLCAVAWSQQRGVSINPPNATIQPGESVTLTATGATFYLWSPAAGLSTTIGPVTVASPSVTTTYTCTGYEPGDEKVQNGNFAQGNVGFTSSYTYNNNVYGEGTYCVDNDASLHHTDFEGHGHGDGGKFMIVNGATSPGTNVWTEQIAVHANTYYAFSTWVCTLHSGNEAQLQFSINGQQLGPVFTAPTSPNIWLQFYQIWYSGTATAATITILNQNTNAGGNDFGLDDISFCELVYDSEAHCTVTVDALTANDDNATTCEGEPVDISVLPNDHLVPGCTSPTVMIIQNPAHGSAALVGNQVRYTPQAGYSGTDTFRYSINCSGQTSSATVHVTVSAEPHPTITADPPVALYGGTVTLTANANAAGSFSYRWRPEDKVTNASAMTTTTVALFEPTTFSVTITNNNGGCQGSEDIVVAIEGSSMTATATADNTQLCQGGSTTLHARPVGGSGDYTFLWAPANTLSNATVQDPVATPPVGTTTYSCVVSDGYSTQTVSVSVTVHPNVMVERELTICEGDSIYFYGYGYVSEPNIYVHHSVTPFGCDSIVRLVLYNWEAYEEQVTDYFCAGHSYNYDGHSYDHPGTYTISYETVHGCDSIVRLTLYNWEAYEEQVTGYFCTGHNYNFDGHSYDQPGTYTIPYETVHGCDSIVYLTLYNLDGYEEQVTGYFCTGHSYNYDGHSYDQPGTYTITYETVDGCDSIVSLTLYNLEDYEEQVTDYICTGHSYSYDGHSFDQPGIYTIPYETVQGCDSIVRLTLIENQSYDYSLPDGKICDGSVYHFGDQIITETGDYTYTGTTIDGCDSIVHIRIDISDHDEIYYDVNREEPENTCEQYFWDPRGKTFTGEQTLYLTHSGLYQRTYQSNGGCDSIVNLHVDLEHVPQPSEIYPSDPANVAPHWVIPATEFQVNSFDYKVWETAGAHWDTVVWSLDKSNWVLEPYGDKGRYCKVYVMESVNDTVWLTARVYNRCASEGGSEQRYWLVSSFYDVDENVSAVPDFSILPNPNQGTMTLRFDNMSGKADVRVFDMQGIMVDRFEMMTDGTLATRSYFMPCHASGMYLFVVTSQVGSVSKKVIVID